MSDISIADVTCLVAFLGLSALASILLKKLRFPYTIGLVVIGIVVGGLAARFKLLEPMSWFAITPNVILYVLLPALIFDAAVNIDLRLLIHNLTPTLILAGPGLILATLVTGGLVAWFTPLPLGAALAFGALISATDPVAVIALFRELGAPRRLAMLVDGESLFNDATAMVAFQIMCGLVLGGSMTLATFAWAGMEFLAVFIGGTLVGMVIGYLTVRISRWIDNDPPVTIAFSTVAAYASFLLANHYLRVSGVMAVVGAGLVISWFSRTSFTRETREYMRHFWSYAAFVANSFVFLLLGLTEFNLLHDLRHYMGMWPLIMGTVAAITIARALVVFGLMPLVNRLPHMVPVDRRNQTVMFWGGLRGALPIGLALSLAHDFPGRSMIIGLTLGVVLFTLLAQGTTIGMLIRRLGLNRMEPFEQLLRFNAQIAACSAGQKSLDRLHITARPDLMTELRQGYREKLRLLEQRSANWRAEHRLDPRMLRRRMCLLWGVHVERRIITALLDEGLISGRVFRRLDRECERRSEDIERDTAVPCPALPHRQANPVSWRARLPRGMFAPSPIAAYRYHAGIMLACERVLNETEMAAQADIFTAPELDDLRAGYAARRDTAAARMRALDDLHPDLARQLTYDLLANTTRAAARDMMENFAHDSGLDDAAVRELEREMGV